MTFLPDNLNLGRVKEQIPKDLSEVLVDSYKDVATNVNKKTDLVVRSANPASTDIKFKIGTMWINQSTNKVYVLTSKSGAPVSSTWSLLN